MSAANDRRDAAMDDDAEFQRWNARYETPDYYFGTEPNLFLAAQRDRLKPGWKAIAVADGEGRNGVWLARQGLDVLSVDFSPAAQEKARALAARHSVAIRLERADLTRRKWESDHFDIAVAIFIQTCPPPERDDILRGIKQSLKPGGLLILQGYRPEQLAYGTGGPPRAENMYTETFLRAFFADMKILHLAVHDDRIEEGSHHRGMSALIDMVAQKA
jgi:SAM-dependent methyltransferase